MHGVNSKLVANALRAMETELPAIPVKRYFTIGEVGELCGVKPHVLRYWEQEFSQLRPMKRRGNRRYYQHHEVLMIRRIRELLYEQGFTISGARNRLQELGLHVKALDSLGEQVPDALVTPDSASSASGLPVPLLNSAHVRQELLEIRNLLSVGLEKAEFDAII
jgi:DNA-binding transcriptional MerR regulator